MFRGRRRAPILGTALVIGASRSAARHEVAAQSQAQQQAQIQQQQAIQQAQYEADAKRRAEEETARRTQLAIDEAIAKERERSEKTTPVGHGGQGGQYVGGAGYGQPQQYGGQPQQHLVAQPQQQMGGPPLQPGQDYAPPYTQYVGGEVGMGASGSDSKGAAGVRFCGNCGNQCRSVDKFCNRCGMKQVVDA